MDASILSVGTQEWLSNTIFPILMIVVPVWVFLSTTHKAAMKGKVDKETYNAEIEAVKKDIKEAKEGNVQLKKEIKDDLSYIRQRLDQVADLNKGA